MNNVGSVCVADLSGDFKPIFYSPALFCVTENRKKIGSIKAGIGISYSIVGGSDADSFTIDPISGALSFVLAPDYEDPSDSNDDNIFNVVVKAVKQYAHSYQSVIVVVSDVSPEGMGGPPPEEPEG